ncbi:MAG: metallophosphoesterase [Clostridia bacterium]|nr:metallophosphoesterase [Clostridia bacterium]MDE7328770.1 metallophosphoesterase [Clostridia bacterium]
MKRMGKLLVLAMLVLSILAVSLTGCASFTEFEWSGEERGRVDLTLSVDEDGNFTILQMADIQFTDAIGANSVEVMDASIESAKPDLIVLTGDQISPEYLIGQKGKAKKILNQITSYFDSKRIPWTAEFGNHDGACGVISKKEMLEIYQKSAYFIGGLEEGEYWESYINEDEDTYCNYFLPIYDASKTEIVHGVILIDCATSLTSPYKGFTKGQIDFYNEMSEKYKGVEFSMYTHEPTQEFQTMYDNREDTSIVPEFKGEIESPEDGKCYYPTKDPEMNEYFKESLIANKNVKGIYVGHDHLSNFAGIYNIADDYSMLLAYGRMSSYGYGEWKYFMFSASKRKEYKNYPRGARVVSLSEGNYSTYEIYDAKNGDGAMFERNRIYL